MKSKRLGVSNLESTVPNDNHMLFYPLPIQDQCTGDQLTLLHLEEDKLDARNFRLYPMLAETR